MDFLGQPPHTNRGVQNTSESALVSCVDWLQVTFKKISDATQIFDLLGIDKVHFREQKGGMYGWGNTYATLENEIRIFYDSESCHLMMSGKGCRFFEKYSSINWSLFLAIIQNTDINIKRLDLAIDDFKGYFTPATIYRKIKQNCLVSRFKMGRWIESFNIQDYEKKGTTIYIGSPKSPIQIRIYDKLKEREANNLIVDEKVSHWVRTEIQMRDERAEGAALMIALYDKEIGKLASGILKNYLSFKIKNKNESNKSRWKDCKWWSNYLGDVEKIAITQTIEEPTLEKTVDWANKQWQKSMYSMYLAFEQDIDLFYKMMLQGQSKMDTKDYKKIEDFRRKYGELTYDEFVEKKKTNRIDDSL